MFCTNCGKPVPESANFCPECGHAAPEPLSTTPTIPTQAPLEPASPHSSGCPHCGTILDPPPKRKKKCPSCGQYVFVKTRPSDRQRVLVTEDEAKKIEAEWERTNWLNQWLGTLEGYGITRKDYEARKEERSRKLGVRASDRDTIWAIFNELVLDMMKSGGSKVLSSLGGLYFTMAMFLDEEGKDFLEVRRQGAKAELERYRSSDVVKYVEVLAADDSCPYCSSLNRKVFTIEEALRDMPIPGKDCTYKLRDDSVRGWCRCCYAPVVRLEDR